MCLFGGGGGQSQPQIVYKDAPLAPLPAPAPTMMNSGVTPANDPVMTSDDPSYTPPNTAGTSIFKIKRDPTTTDDYSDQGLDSGIYY
jgi:hypothetical protein